MAFRTHEVMKVLDSDAAPFITQKNVVLCRSGIQLYHKSELNGFIDENNKPPVEKEWYREYRPANVVVKAKEKCRTLAVTREHPLEWVTPDNFSELAGGVTDKEVEVVALDGESEGEIGLSSSLTFFTRDLYNYYLEGNKEVSLGYTCVKEWVADPEKAGYDIILKEILEVNHVAVTRSGRGGSSVAVADNKAAVGSKEMAGGKKELRTNILSWLTGKQKDSKFSFSEAVLKCLKDNKKTTEENFTSEYKGVLDSLAGFKDSDRKKLLIDAVRDCADNREAALGNTKELAEVLDSMYAQLVKDSEEEKKEALEGESSEKKEESKDSEEEKKEESKDSEEEKKEESKDSEEEKKEESKDSEEEKKEDGCSSKDSSAFKEEILSAVKDSIKDIVAETVRETLGLKSDGKAEGLNLDSKESSRALVDYSDFLD